ncbi:MAG: dTDP-4-dehydrorhamnose 3,5-epimerase family protein [Deltaproteobacteria bacterium]|nr:dTDP-4-dehydrorhamnose 3,5-epimerase family protein [Deltaproteobacteria bacterium]
MFKDGQIEGVRILSLKRFSDERGWLMELFRKDGLDEGSFPVMTYISMTRPDMKRGPHEHMEQTDYFCFTGRSVFKVYLWDNRPESETYGNKMEIVIGEDNPSIVIVPPRIVHGYKNIGESEGIIINCPNRLFKGWGKKESVDEVRYEDDIDSAYRLG